MKKNVTLICDLMFGSTGKGACAGYLALKNKPDTVVTAWSPNAGHTFVDESGRSFVHCMLANGIVSPNLKTVMIAPGSVINLDGLRSEIVGCLYYMEGKTVVIHENAAICLPRHIEAESEAMIGIGSTKKGSGAALVEKIQRHMTKIVAKDHKQEILDMFRGLVNVVVVNTDSWLQHLNDAEEIQVEGAQGFSLGVNAGFYPFTTSRECSPAQIMSDTLISTRRVKNIVGVMRTFPIRVANRYDENGKMVGYSGPCYPDQKELSWEDVKQKPELTTVTKLERRIFSFSLEQTKQALSICSPDEVYLSFCDYVNQEELEIIKRKICTLSTSILGKDVVKYMSFGPSVCDVKEAY